jgi:hypothetical protein
MKVLRFFAVVTAMALLFGCNYPTIELAIVGYSAPSYTRYRAELSKEYGSHDSRIQFRNSPDDSGHCNFGHPRCLHDDHSSTHLIPYVL